MFERNSEVTDVSAYPQDLQRVALCIEYAGAGFNGFQRQASTPNTVQQYLEAALSFVADEAITLVCAGRTDAGVHATGQIVHFDTASVRPEKAWVMGSNTRLPDAIRVRWARAVDPQFHARFSALSRTYRYVFHCSDVRSATLGTQVTHSALPLDFDAMEQAASCLIGEHDFSAFRSAQCQAHSPVRRIEAMRWVRQGELVVLEIRANAFLHHMVRNIVGTLMDVGRGRQAVSWVRDILEGGDRTRAGATAPPWGLYLVQVAYPESIALPELPAGPCFLSF